MRHIPEEELEQFLLKSLPPFRSREVEEHLLACPKCIDHAEALAMVMYFLRRAAGANTREAQLPRASKRGRLPSNVITLPVAGRAH